MGHDLEVTTDAASSDRVGKRPIVIASNRGPLSFRLDNSGTLLARRGAGGLVSGLAPLVSNTDAIWIAAALSVADRVAAKDPIVERHGFRTQLLDIDPETYSMAYDVVCNATLWFLYHGLFDLARRPRFDARFSEAWDAFRSVNAAFATAIAATAPANAIVLVQDYHLSLIGPLLTLQRPDVTAIHFTHTPFASPELIRVLPDRFATELLEGLAGYHSCGFHSQRWSNAFIACCTELGVQPPPTFVTPLASDPADLAATASSAECDAAFDELDQTIGDRKFLVRVDRIELSKNLVRGFHAFDDLLTRYPEWRERVIFGAFLYPSREGLPEYLAYRQEVETIIKQLNDRWRTAEWEPIVVDLSDDFPRSVAALRRYDVLMVNPLRDGLNLVAKEGAIVNEYDGILALSSEAGVWDELGPFARRVHPYDISDTADVLAAALASSPDQRRSESALLKATSLARSPADWLADLIAQAD